jgi:preprotein translocase subunit SecG
MGIFEWIMGGALVVMAIFLLIVVLMQTGKDKSLSGTIGGGSADTYYGQNKRRSRDKVLAILTTVVAIVFVALVVVFYVLQA